LSEIVLTSEQRAVLEALVEAAERKSVVLPSEPELHYNQKLIHEGRGRFNNVCCGRRFGKTTLDICEALEVMRAGKPVGWFAANYKIGADAWRQLKVILQPITERSNETDKRIEVVGGGSIEMWSLDNEDPGRSRKYALAVCDEPSLVHNFKDIWLNAIRPTLMDYRGSAWFSYTPKGRNDVWQLYQMGLDPNEPEWTSWRMPTTSNPYINADEVEAARRSMPDRAFRQEILAEFIEETGGVFRNVLACVRAGCEACEAPSSERVYTLGVDLARVNDFTVLTVVDDAGRQVFFDRFNEVSWERQVNTIERVAKQYNAKVMLDSTGLGDPIFEAISRKGIFVEGVKLTNASKSRIIDNLAMMLENNEVSLMDIPEQTAELEAYEYDMTQFGNVRMSAPSGMHDDTCIALALAVHRKDMAFSIEDIVTSGCVREAYGTPF